MQQNRRPVVCAFPRTSLLAAARYGLLSGGLIAKGGANSVPFRNIACMMMATNTWTCHTEGFGHFVTSMTAPVASGWSVRWVGLPPTGKRRLLTAHARSGSSDKPSNRLPSEARWRYPSPSLAPSRPAAVALRPLPSATLAASSISDAFAQDPTRPRQVARRTLHPDSTARIGLCPRLSQFRRRGSLPESADVAGFETASSL
jgi:hypothetical protein